ncbi:hypothetical protein PITC_009090 [Penicillium italicum]|uniref:Uncharacterized protein n=1 Tax=Penicillium italicum TaxID=40296 RepID=A0A0A2KKG4_PENIT|nr:hypothetical protein PITC_009090 [Penicillium italicum]
MDRFHNFITQITGACVSSVEYRYPFGFGTRYVLPTTEV